MLWTLSSFVLAMAVCGVIWRDFLTLVIGNLDYSYPFGLGLTWYTRNPGNGRWDLLLIQTYFGQKLQKGQEPIQTKSDFFLKQPGIPVWMEIISQEEPGSQSGQISLNSQFSATTHIYLIVCANYYMTHHIVMFGSVYLYIYIYFNNQRESIIVSVPSPFGLTQQL